MRTGKTAAVLLAALLLLAAFAGCGDQTAPSPAPTQAAEGGQTPETGASEPETAQAEEPQQGEQGQAEEPGPGEQETAPLPTEETRQPLPEDEDLPPAESLQLTAFIDGANHSVEARYYENVLRRAEPAVSFSLYYDAAAYEPVFANNAYRFLPLPPEMDAEEEAEEMPSMEEEAPEMEAEAAEPLCYLEVCLVNGTTVSEIGPTFMDGYLDFSEIEFSSFASLGAQRLNAARISAYNEGQYVEAYLTDVSGGVAAVVLSAPSNSEEDFLWFRAMLSTFRLL